MRGVDGMGGEGAPRERGRWRDGGPRGFWRGGGLRASRRDGGLREPRQDGSPREALQDGDPREPRRHDGPRGSAPGEAPRLLLGALGLNQFAVAAAAGVVAPMGPALHAAHGLPPAWLPWAVLAYLLPLGGLVLPLRRLIRRTGPLAVLIAGLWLFVQASVACTVVPGQVAFLVLRGVQGTGGAALTAVALALVPVRSDRLLLGWDAVVLAGLGAGLTAGAVLTGPDWRWALWATIPPTAAGGLTTVRRLRAQRHVHVRKPQTVPGPVPRDAEPRDAAA
ncbi:MFS transporter [Streptomyces sp. NPDC002896]|uniref:MFS transporter n=1 Tax=Streptomyces sp. NPDC002896 TaxID=3154438 RepID=UPI003318ACB7